MAAKPSVDVVDAPTLISSHFSDLSALTKLSWFSSSHRPILPEPPLPGNPPTFSHHSTRHLPSVVLDRLRHTVASPSPPPVWKLATSLHHVLIGIDKTLFIWNYRLGGSHPISLSFNAHILAVGVCRPWRGVFSADVRQIVVVSTEGSIEVLGMCLAFEEGLQTGKNAEMRQSIGRVVGSSPIDTMGELLGRRMGGERGKGGEWSNSGVELNVIRLIRCPLSGGQRFSAVQCTMEGAVLLWNIEGDISELVYERIDGGGNEGLTDICMQNVKNGVVRCYVKKVNKMMGDRQRWMSNFLSSEPQLCLLRTFGTNMLVTLDAEGVLSLFCMERKSVPKLAVIRTLGGCQAATDERQDTRSNSWWDFAVSLPHWFSYRQSTSRQSPFHGVPLSLDTHPVQVYIVSSSSLVHADLYSVRKQTANAAKDLLHTGWQRPMPKRPRKQASISSDSVKGSAIASEVQCVRLLTRTKWQDVESRVESGFHERLQGSVLDMFGWIRVSGELGITVVTAGGDRVDLVLVDEYHPAEPSCRPSDAACDRFDRTSIFTREPLFVTEMSCTTVSQSESVAATGIRFEVVNVVLGGRAQLDIAQASSASDSGVFHTGDYSSDVEGSFFATAKATAYYSSGLTVLSSNIPSISFHHDLPNGRPSGGSRSSCGSRGSTREFLNRVAVLCSNESEGTKREFGCLYALCSPVMMVGEEHPLFHGSPTDQAEFCELSRVEGDPDLSGTPRHIVILTCSEVHVLRTPSAYEHMQSHFSPATNWECACEFSRFPPAVDAYDLLARGKFVENSATLSNTAVRKAHVVHLDGASIPNVSMEAMDVCMFGKWHFRPPTAPWVAGLAGYIGSVLAPVWSSPVLVGNPSPCCPLDIDREEAPVGDTTAEWLEPQQFFAISVRWNANLLKYCSLQLLQALVFLSVSHIKKSLSSSLLSRVAPWERKPFDTKPQLQSKPTSHPLQHCEISQETAVHNVQRERLESLCQTLRIALHILRLLQLIEELPVHDQQHLWKLLCTDGLEPRTMQPLFLLSLIELPLWRFLVEPNAARPFMKLAEYLITLDTQAMDSNSVTRRLYHDCPWFAQTADPLRLLRKWTRDMPRDAELLSTRSDVDLSSISDSLEFLLDNYPYEQVDLLQEAFAILIGNSCVRGAVALAHRYFEKTSEAGRRGDSFSLTSSCVESCFVNAMQPLTASDEDIERLIIVLLGCDRIGVHHSCPMDMVSIEDRQLTPMEQLQFACLDSLYAAADKDRDYDCRSLSDNSALVASRRLAFLENMPNPPKVLLDYLLLRAQESNSVIHYESLVNIWANNGEFLRAAVLLCEMAFKTTYCVMVSFQLRLDCLKRARQNIRQYIESRTVGNPSGSVMNNWRNLVEDESVPRSAALTKMFSIILSKTGPLAPDRAEDPLGPLGEIIGIITAQINTCEVLQKPLCSQLVPELADQLVIPLDLEQLFQVAVQHNMVHISLRALVLQYCCTPTPSPKQTQDFYNIAGVYVSRMITTRRLDTTAFKFIHPSLSGRLVEDSISNFPTVHHLFYSVKLSGRFPPPVCSDVALPGILLDLLDWIWAPSIISDAPEQASPTSPENHVRPPPMLDILEPVNMSWAEQFCSTDDARSRAPWQGFNGILWVAVDWMVTRCGMGLDEVLVTYLELLDAIVAQENNTGHLQRPNRFLSGSRLPTNETNVSKTPRGMHFERVILEFMLYWVRKAAVDPGGHSGTFRRSLLLSCQKDRWTPFLEFDSGLRPDGTVTVMDSSHSRTLLREKAILVQKELARFTDTN
eukprot:GHVQ01013941.1.p1 GENE.GHVQ01013941.1~~GHVQ01013941.1.p1  ORF type:complete len:1772 (-),score=180.10 GHVQ01013941.1:5559-10874(-)